jgi:endonuclease/exonuclease/phosphatase family metal-dependent hydrolase
VTEFRIVTYNIHKARGLDGRRSITRILRVLCEIKPDIVALQEVVSHEGKSIEDHQASYLASELGYRLAVGQTREHQGGVYGNVTLSRWEFETIRQIDVSVPGREARGILRTDIRMDRMLLHVFNVHLGTGHPERHSQANRLLDADLLRAVDISGPRVVLGDFNEWTRGAVTRTLTGEFHLTDLHLHLARRRTYPTLLPVLHLDHIYFDHHLATQKAWFHASRSSIIASDHLPLVADMKVLQ